MLVDYRLSCRQKFKIMNEYGPGWNGRTKGDDVHISEYVYLAAGFWLTALLILLTIVLVVRARAPKKRLFYGLRTATPMVTGPEGSKANIEVRRRSDGYELLQPYHAEVVLENRGRSAIEESDFSSRKSVRLRLGAPIKILYKTQSEPSDRAIPDVNIGIDDDWLSLGRDLSQGSKGHYSVGDGRTSNHEMRAA
jgi:hypothetical protein